LKIEKQLKNKDKDISDPISSSLFWKSILGTFYS